MSRLTIPRLLQLPLARDSLCHGEETSPYYCCLIKGERYAFPLYPVLLDSNGNVTILQVCRHSLQPCPFRSPQSSVFLVTVIRDVNPIFPNRHEGSDRIFLPLLVLFIGWLFLYAWVKGGSNVIKQPSMPDGQAGPLWRTQRL